MSAAENDDSPRISRREDVVLTRTGGEALLVDEQNGKVHVVNQSAAALWELCDGQPTLERLVEAMARAYGVSQATLRADVESMLRTFGELGLLHSAAAP